ncbi:CoA transferase [Tepidiforma flava]|uniref:CoA transferase n=1 Tax=Tepidiforma flava TaxID=3004094 RepID=A0ABY7M7W7_9CHLR|nr:CoA transferase [Tepidiforma flava]WBL36608.1 CoA transferase [Tepidiforma flava]
MELLAGLRVCAASRSPAAAYAAWLLGQFGAEVRHATALDPEGLGAFLAPGAIVEPEPQLRPQPGDLLITDAPVTDASRAALDALARDHLVAWVTPFGLDTPWECAPSTSLTRYAAGGWMHQVGDPAREPLAPPGAQDLFVAGLWAALAAAAFAERGPGLIDVPVVAALAATTIYDAVAFQYFGRLRGRVGERYAPTQPTIVTLPCADGFVGIHAALHGMWVTLAQLAGHPELVDDPRFASPTDRAANIRDLDACLLPWLGRHSHWELYHLLQQHRVCAAALPTLDEVLASPQLAAREAWRTAETPSGRRYRVPGPPARVLAEAGPAEPGYRAAPGPWRPGALRVVDLSMGWAGPLVGHVLAALGADVIKVESHTHFDWWRGSRPPGDDPGLELHERSHVFNAVNRGKRGITLDLAHPTGRDLALQLISSADVLIENFAAGVLERLGLGWDELAARNPRLVMLRQPAFGSYGPEAGYVGFGNTIEGMSGLSSLIGYENGPPTMLANACGDPVSGLIGALAVLSALRARERDGRGRLLECAQLEGFLPLVSDELIAFQRTGDLPRRRGNRRPGHTPSGVYPAAGDDRWVAIEVATEAQWAALAELVGGPLADPALADAAAREARRDAIDAALSAWTAAQTDGEAARRLQERGIPAAPVNTEADLLTFGPLDGPGFWVGEEREPVGFHLYPALAVRSGGQYVAAMGPAPRLGQHTAEVLAGLGLEPAAILGLEAAGITGTRPAPRARA